MKTVLTILMVFALAPTIAFAATSTSAPSAAAFDMASSPAHGAVTGPRDPFCDGA